MSCKGIIMCMKPTDSHIEKEVAKISSFIKTGLFTLTVIFIAGMAIIFSQNKAAQTTGALGNNVIHQKELPIYSVDTDEPVVALSFDAAWGNEDTPRLLEILEKNDVKVTFFMTGGWIEKYPEDVKAIAAAGHELGNHSENHKEMSKISAEECKTEIMTPHEKVKELTGVEMKVFRPPYGDYNDTLINTLKDCGYYGIQWDVDSLDWRDYSVDTILSNVLNHKALSNGSIILCHNGGKHTADALDQLIAGLKEKGYRFAKISDLIYPDNYEIDVTGKQHLIGSNE